MPSSTFSRRSFLAFSAALPWAFLARAAKSFPVGLELYSVRDELKKDSEGTVRAVAKMGYQGVEFYAPYFEWSESQAKQMRKLLGDLGIRCFSTHNDSSYLNAENIRRARDLNLILGSRYVVVASAEPGPGLEGWKTVADALNFAADQLEASGLRAGYHNHQSEFTAVANQRPMEILAKNTKPSIMLQLDVGTCLQAGSDPVAWIRSNPGRIRSLHCKDWSADPAKGYAVLFGEGQRIGRIFSLQRRALAGLSITWWSRKAAGTPSSRPQSGASKRFEANIQHDGQGSRADRPVVTVEP